MKHAHKRHPTIMTSKALVAVATVVIAPAVFIGCVPLIPTDGAPCPCAEGSVCCDGVCVVEGGCEGPSLCGNGVVDDGEVCDPGQDEACDGPSAPLNASSCASDCQSVSYASCERPLDLLIVVDSSGSMCEEQDALRRGLWDPRCPITDLADIPDVYAGASPATLESLAQVCGLVQLLAVLSPSVHVGVITTDASACDNDFGISSIPDHPNLCSGESLPDWGRRPQRGCLQGEAVNGSKVIRSSDANVVDRIATAILSVGTLGSGVERGLDAIEAFLDEDEARPAACEGDLDDFLRDDARLAVLIVSDEDDCSHDASWPYGDELASDDCSAESQGPSPIDASVCYTNPAALRDVDETKAFLATLKGNEERVSVVLFGGVTKAEEGYAAGGCRLEAGAPTTECTASFGTSNFVGSGFLCDEAALEAEGLPPCCTADAAPRYHQFVESFGERGAMSSICTDQLPETVRDVALFLSAAGALPATE